MTDNRVLVDEEGNEAVFVNRSDGYAVARLKEQGYLQVIISTEKNMVVEARARKLGIEVIYGVEDKGKTLLEYCKGKGIDPSEVMFIGNDANDLLAFEVAGMTGAPADAEKEVFNMAYWKSSRKGGYGVIRELYNHFNMTLIG
ncbi:MAG: HAD hydrolase family protein [Acetatifactor sp.]|nr:HAD hydrolase family protein [Acetatifactor sp.]